MEVIFKCPKCNSSQTRFLIKTQERVCYVCGHRWKLEEEKENGRP